MTELSSQTAIFILYFILLLFIGYLASRRTKNQEDYLLGGRQLGPLTAALSAGASDMSGWLLLGLPGYAYASGLEASWLALGLVIGTWANWQFVAPRLRTASQAYNNSLTMPSYFKHRFPDQGKLLSLVSSFFILIFFTFYTASGLVAGGKLFESVFGYSYEIAVVISVIAIVLYTVIGGFLAVAWTDVFQGLLMAFALTLVPIIAMTSTTTHALSPEFLNPLTNISGEPLTLIAIVSLMAWGLGYFGQPHILARFKAVKSVAVLPQAKRIALTWTCLGLVSACMIGLAGRMMYGSDMPDGEKVLLVLIEALFHPVIAGIILAAVLAAIMSTADSQLLVSSSVLVEDVYKLLSNNKGTEQTHVLLSRGAVIIVAIIAMAIALGENRKVLDLVGYAWAGFGAAFGPLVILSLYNKGLSSLSAVIGIVVGATTVIIWGNLSGGWFDVYELLPGFILSWVAIVVSNQLIQR